MEKIVTLFAALAMLASTGLAHAYDGQQLRHEAGIGIRKARVIATGEFPGTIVGEELEKEAGGSGLRYSFDIKKNDVVREVGVDAVTGKVLENSPEGPNPD